MTYFEFTKRFPDETSAINFIVSVKHLQQYVDEFCQTEQQGLRQRLYEMCPVGSGINTDIKQSETEWKNLKRHRKTNQNTNRYEYIELQRIC